MSKRAKKGLTILGIAAAALTLLVILMIGTHSSYAGSQPYKDDKVTLGVNPETPVNVSVQAGGSASEKSTGIVTMSFFLTGADTLNSITISNTGLTAGSIDVSVYVNIRGKKSLRNAVLLGSVAAWNGSSTVISKTPGIAFGAAGAYVFVVYDLPSTATGAIQTNLIQVVTGTTNNNAYNSGSRSIIAKTACVDLIQVDDCGKCHNFNGYYQVYYPYSTVRGNQKSHDMGYGRIHGGHRKYDCKDCHNNADKYLINYTSAVPQHLNNATNVGPLIFGISTSGNKYGTYDSVAKTCATVDCHLGVTSPKWGVNAVTPTNLASCAACHAAPPATGAHTQHFSMITGWANTSADCQNCHYGAGTGFAENHADGAVDVIIDPALGSKNGTSATNKTPTYTPSGVKNGTCANTSCHGGITTLGWTNGAGIGTEPFGIGNYAPSNTKYRFTIAADNKTYLKCTLCHKIDSPSPALYNNPTEYNSARSAKHTDHAVAQTAGFLTYTGNAGLAGGTNYNRKRIKVDVCLACHNDAHKSDIATTGNTIAFALANLRNIALVNAPAAAWGTSPYGTGSALLTYSDTTTTAANLTLDNTLVQSIVYSATATSGTCTTTVCHGNNITWNPTTTLSCLDCHSSQKGTHANIQAEFAMSSRHVQGVTGNANASHCYQCHWEAKAINGQKDPLYHVNASPNPGIQLVKYLSNNFRPTVFSGNHVNYNRNPYADLVVNEHCLSCHNDSMKGMKPFPGDTRNTNQFAWDGSSVNSRYFRNQAANSHNFNATRFNVVPPLNQSASPHYNMQLSVRDVAVGRALGDDAASMVAGTFNATNMQAGSVSCLDCHNSHGSNLASTAPFGSTVVSYAPFEGVGGILKQTWSGTHGYGANYRPTEKTDYLWSAQAAFCFDCHLGADPLDAANTTAPTRDYRNFGRPIGNIIAGYYDPVNWANTAPGNNTARHGGGRWYIAANTTQTNAQYGYTYRGNTTNAAFWRGEFEFKNGTIIGTHFKKFVGYDTAGLGQLNWMAIANSGSASSNLQGKCTKCHDPHGVPAAVNLSNTLDANRFYYSPILKGSYLTSPYFEDRPGDRNTTINPGGDYFYFNSWAGQPVNMGNTAFTGTRGGPIGGPRVLPTQIMNRPPRIGAGYGVNAPNSGQDGFFIDDNTFGVNLMRGTTVYANLFNRVYTADNMANFWYTNPIGSTRTKNTTNVWVNIGNIGLEDTQFAGLCLQCHLKTALINTNSSWTTNRSLEFRTRAHRTVKGWSAGATANADIFPRNYLNRSGNLMPSGTIFGANVLTNSLLSEKAWGSLSGLVDDLGLIEDTSRYQVGFRFSWGINFVQQDSGAANVQNQYHNFPCSKCHRAHAARLPRLMKTNCLDVITTPDTGGNWRFSGTANNRNVYWQKHTVNATGNKWIGRMKSSTVESATANYNNVSSWQPTRPTRCHNTPLFRDAANRTFWNDVTPWYEN